ncbi:MAG TPA: hypothetical protein VFM02_00745 [Candidatus Paceibacterota bacterium]|nr:hypothetical protein [Candidatus Paceibacterota bacterium]
MHSLEARTIGKAFLFLLVAGVVVTYSVFRFFDYTKGPTIAITSPLDGSTVRSGFVNVVGSADRISYITLNGKQIYTDNAGNFNQELALHDGYNALEVQVKDRFGRINTKTIKLVYQEPDHVKNGVALKRESTSTNPT